MRQIDYGEAGAKPLGDANPHVRRAGKDGRVQIAGEVEAPGPRVSAGMFSRRNMFKLGGAGGAAAVLSLLPTGAAAYADSRGLANATVTDLTHTLSPDFPIFYPLADPPSYEPHHVIGEEGFNTLIMTLDEHSGTHIDAPAHFKDGQGPYVDEIEPNQLIAPLRVIRIADRAAEDDNTLLNVDDIRQHERTYGRIPSGAFVAMDSGWSARVDRPGEYLNEQPDGTFRWPGFGADATAFLVDQRGIVGIGADTTSLDAGVNDGPECHQILLPTGHYGIENLNNLGSVPDRGATIVVGAPKHRGGFGGPARVFALT
ncbi:cyclase family protein [Nocardiopsis sediminis]|uniref:Cyclase family protein n=1 Tax=Nocardiopsis sediminis TaxID=1778267 RepID=A0ABV8FLI2_9ACTN